ncbi:hypothetical protein GFS31_23670 [Leptolyngbya sp. BL0902]|uniref:DUF1176 domain-containing protein n=1 Tax=Leptolyngbya sp. BL0902 TaxID=1115757 RepID=UPI0018E8EA18|nr:DUF1176 domain-containing protein [Leptolyngbya sp. BL0902]QQE65679.1 hypothetical protein GFS31_23670 [Leptolyngbya sp. BL0902]
MIDVPWRWSLLALLLAAVGCQSAPLGSPSAPSSGGETVAVDWASDADLLPAVLAQVEDLDLCDGFFQAEVAAAESEIYPMGDRALVQVLCAHAAYQSVYAYAAVFPDGTLEPLTLDVFYPDGAGDFQRASEATVGGIVNFDPSYDELTVFSKARGLGDCGSFAVYRWTGQALDLETYRYQDCTDTPERAPHPATYPLVYP